MKQSSTMSLTNHLKELRGRLLKISIILLSGTIIAVLYSKELYTLLQAPLVHNLPPSAGFIALSPIEGWVVYLKVAFFAAFFLTAPLWFYQIWAFVAPALVTSERRVVAIAGILSAAFFIAGGLFGYLVILPVGFHYLVQVFNGTRITVYPQMQWYLSFILRALFAFGLVFETPLVLALLAYFGITTASAMRRARRYVIVGIFVFAAIITPGPDVFSQIMVAIPLIIFYEFGIVAAWIMERKRQSLCQSN